MLVVGNLFIAVMASYVKINHIFTIMFSDELNEVVEHNQEIETYRKYVLIKNLNPQDVMSLFDSIPLQDVPLLLMKPDVSLPKDLLLTRIAVPPICIRPSVISEMKSGT